MRIRSKISLEQFALFTVICFMLLFLSTLTSCQSPGAKSWSGNQCSINIRKNECYCRGYKLSKDYIGKTTGVKTYPLDHCEGIIGYGPKVYAEQVTFLESVRLQIKGGKSRKAKAAIEPSADREQHETSQSTKGDN